MLRVGLSRRAQTIASVLGIFVALVSVATPHASPISERDGSASAERISLNGTWQFALAPTKEEAQALENFYREGFDVSDFKATPVPSNWAMLGYEPPQYERFTGSASEGFYLRRFRVPAQWSDRRVLLHFDGVWSSAEVWLNGEALGRHDSGFTKISFDISPALKAGAENLLAVRVRQVQQDYLFDTNDDWTMGGIYRNVSLEIMPKLRWLDRIEIQTDFDDEYRDADLNVRVMVGDLHKRVPPGNVDGPYALRLSLFDAVGEKVARQKIAVEGHSGTGREIRTSLRVRAPRHWTAETPNLYRLEVELLEASEAAHTRTVRVGFREISTAGGVLRVNGQAIKLRGVNRHDEHPDTGRATTPAQWLQDIKLMKAANINYIRLAHYPPSEGFIDLCDELGMYVSNEISMGYGGDQMHNPALAGAALLRSYATVARDINHPSVIIWTVGNEDPLTSLHLAALRTVKGLDPTRPLLMPWRAETWLPPEIHLLSPHYFTASKYDELASRADRPIVTTEFSHAFGNDGFGGLQERWQALTQHPSGAGGAIWLWADQGLKIARRGPDGTSSSSLEVVDGGFDGITDSYRRPTRDYWETKAVYAQVVPAVKKIPIILGQPFVRIPIKNDFDFLNLAAIQISWALREDERQLSSGTTQISGPPHAVSWLDLPLNALEEIKPDTTYYYWLTFSHRDGTEIVRRAVELETSSVAHARHDPRSGTLIIKKGSPTSVTAGNATFVFDPATGHLTSASNGNQPRVYGMRPTIWRPMNHTEMIIVKAENGVQSLPDLNRYTPSVKTWTITEQADRALIHAEVDYVVDRANRFTIVYDYAIRASGELSLRYRVSPTVQAKWLPHVGMECSWPRASSDFAGWDSARWTHTPIRMWLRY